MGEVSQTLSRFRRAEIDHVLALDDKTMDEIDKSLALRAGRQSLADQLKAYDAPDQQPRGAQAGEEQAASWLPTTPMPGRLIELSRGGEKTADQAKAWLRGEVIPQHAEDSRGGPVEGHHRHQRPRRGQGSGGGRVHLRLSGQGLDDRALVLAMAAIAIGAALSIVRSLTSQLGGEPARRGRSGEGDARAGDLTTRIDRERGRHDSRASWPRWPRCKPAWRRWSSARCGVELGKPGHRQHADRAGQPRPEPAHRTTGQQPAADRQRRWSSSPAR